MKKISLVIITAILVTFSACSKKQVKVTIEETPAVEIQKGNHTWYSFTPNGYEKVSVPQNATAVPFLPWTEAKRVSSANCTGSVENEIKGFAVVNRLGILCLENDHITLTKDINLFKDRTSGNLVFLNDTPVFSVYKSAFFNDTITDPLYKNNSSNHLFLIQYDDKAEICYPIVNCNNLTKELNSEVTDFYWDGLNWLCSVKTISDTKNSFSYIEWKPGISLLNVSPSSAESNIIIKESTLDDFKEAKAELPYKKAPERIKKLLSGFENRRNFLIEVKTAGGVSPRKFSNQIEDEADVLNAKAIIAQSWSAALFEDGTLFIEGALPGKHILREGKPVAIRLPKLPAGFKYSDFVITGSTLYAFWEETNFYTTARSGILEVNLDKSLYSKLL